MASASPMPAGAMPAAPPSPFAPPPPGVNPFFPFFAGGPSFDLALVGSIVGTVLAVLHSYRVFKTKAKYIALLAQGAVFLGAGMILRLLVILAPSSTASIAMMFLLMAPGPIVAIGLIFTYTRLMWWVTPEEHRNMGTLLLPPRATSICIVLLQSISEIIGTLGSGVIPSPGPRTLAIGAVGEMLTWMFFSMLVIRFTFMSRRWSMQSETDREGSWELGLALSASSILLVIRGVMGVFEKDATQALISTGKPGSIVTTQEWPMWVFDFLPSFLILIIMLVYHPGNYLPKRLTGFRLKTKALVEEKREEQANKEWAISAPLPANYEKSNGIAVAYSDV